MNWMKRHLIYINMVWASILLLGSCTSESGTGTPDVTPVVPSKPTNNTETAVSQDEIKFQITTDENQEANTRAIIYENLDDLKVFNDDPSKPLRIYAYYNDTDKSYIDGMKMRYYANGNQWQFWSGSNESGDWAHLYWPIPNSHDVTNSVNVDSYGTLDFVGYVPYDLPTSTNDNEYKVVYNYSSSTPHFTTTLPYTTGGQNTFNATNQETLQEFLVAYSPDRTKVTDNSALSLSNGVVPINFQRPFALVNFYLKQAKRGTVIHSVSLSDLCVSGVFSYGSSWTWNTTSATKANLSFSLNDPDGLTVPDDVNFNALLGGPFVVIPQALSTSDNLTINSKLPDEGAATNKNATIATTWLPGYIYNYYLNLGTDPNHILVDVEVQPWVTHNKIPIEVK